ncbi:MAG: DUF362 domain-containing protein [Candidatus Omnitrophica bacterium]|nr:DUF362 domain-containing protein [bacterium]MCE7907082.1 DUF362 domain-containing protein [Candidatus Omnitrophica bacterium COP1]MCL4735977.1 DUF362 domain-containing protein [Candidatus Omnitrophota bacterium]
MSRSKVAVVRTSPRTYLADVQRAMTLAGVEDTLPKTTETALKVNISWHHFYPACSTTPWQLEGVIRALLNRGYSRDKIHACHNRTVVVSSKKGEVLNKHLPVVQKHGIGNVHLYENEPWINVRDAVGAEVASKFLVLNKVYPNGFHIPKRFIGENIIHLPTVKTHVFTTMTGAMKNAFGGLLNEKRHWTHEVIHETLVDLLMIQKKIHTGVFAVMDGTFAGDGPGPRCMVPHVKNVILASADQVAIDAMSASLMGFKPLDEIKFIRLSHDMGLGVGDPKEIEVVGDPDVAGENWHFVGPYQKMTFASRMQHKIYWGGLKRPVEWSLKTWLAPWAYVASIAYHDYYWYPFIGKERVEEALHSDWGRLFFNWENLQPDDQGWPDVGPSPDLSLQEAG